MADEQVAEIMQCENCTNLYMNSERNLQPDKVFLVTFLMIILGAKVGGNKRTTRSIHLLVSLGRASLMRKRLSNR
jgi:hypothetical protein